MNNWMITLDGEISHCQITFYIPVRYIIGEETINMDEVLSEYGGLVKIMNENMKYCVFKTAFNSSNEIFVWVKADHPKSIIRPNSNVRVETTRCHSIFGWIEFGIRSLFRYIRDKFNVS